MTSAIRSSVAAGAALASVALLWSATAASMTLAQAGQLALDRDPSVAVYRAQFDADRQAGDIERSALLPLIDIKGSGYYATTGLTGEFGPTVESSQATIKDHYSGYTATAELRQPLFRFDWADRRSRARAEDAQAEVTRLDAVAGVIQQISGRYLDVVLAQDLLKQTEAEAKSLHRSLENTLQRFAVDLIPGTDVKEAQARFDLAQAQLIGARRQLADALDAVSESTGIATVNGLPGLREDAVISPPVPSDPEVWVKLARDNAPNLAQARLAVEIAQADAASTRAQSWPQLDLVASAGRQDSLNFVVGQRVDDARIGVEVTVPIYSGGGIAARERQSDALLVVRQAALDQLQRDTDRKVRQLLRSVQARSTEVSAYRRTLESAMAADVATRHGYDAGTRTIIEVLDGQSRVAQSSRDWNTARYNMLADLLALKRTTGTLTAHDFVEIDQLLEPDTWGTTRPVDPATAP